MALRLTVQNAEQGGYVVFTGDEVLFAHAELNECLEFVRDRHTLAAAVRAEARQEMLASRKAREEALRQRREQELVQAQKEAGRP